MRSREYRRQKIEKYKRKTKNIVVGWLQKEDITHDVIERLVSRVHQNRAKCSCWMCMNPRRHLKGDDRYTIQERKAALNGGVDYDDQMDWVLMCEDD